MHMLFFDICGMPDAGDTLDIGGTFDMGIGAVVMFGIADMLGTDETLGLDREYGITLSPVIFISPSLTGPVFCALAFCIRLSWLALPLYGWLTNIWYPPFSRNYVNAYRDVG
jgi:hypothetical protein